MLEAMNRLPLWTYKFRAKSRSLKVEVTGHLTARGADEAYTLVIAALQPMVNLNNLGLKDAEKKTVEQTYKVTIEHIMESGVLGIQVKSTRSEES